MKRVSVRGVDLSVCDQGRGVPILFVHGFPLDHTMWQPQIEEFSRTHRVIAPDLRGLGASGATPGRVTMDDFADDLAALLGSLHVSGPVIFCGLSMGGYIAWSFLRRHPHRLRGLILCDTRAAADSPEGMRARQEMARAVLERGPAHVFDAMSSRLFAANTPQRLPHVVEQVRRMMLGGDPRGIAAAALGMAERTDATELLPRITVPTLLIVGEEDRISPPTEMQAIAAAIPGAEFVRVPGAGHMAPLENPQAVNAAMRRFIGGDQPQNDAHE